MKKFYEIALILGTLLISSCKSSSKADSESKIEPDIDGFDKKSMEVCHYVLNNIINIDTYYRKDKLQEVPHISLKKYYNLLTKKEMSINKTSDGVYEVIANKEKAIINTNKDTLDTDDYAKFISTSIYRQDDVQNYYFDGAPFLKVKEVVYETKPKHIQLDFNKYGIDLIGTDDDIILPITTASNLFTGPTMITCFTTKNRIYFIDPNDSTYETSSYYMNAEVNKDIVNTFKNGKRSVEIANYTYRQLCFLIDTYYGLPGREYIHNELAETRDLDAVLSSKNDMSKKAKELLLSTDMYEYFAGIDILDSFLSDAGHSVASVGVRYVKMNNPEINTKVGAILDSIGFDASDYAAKRNADNNYTNTLYKKYMEKNISNNSYKKYGDTLVYRFESFMFDLNGWIAHYKEPSMNPIPNDAFYNFKKMLDENEKDSSIKNVVLDISFNGGGFGDMVVGMMGLMTGQTYLHCKDMVTDSVVTTKFDLDANFDGVFDEKDKNVSYHYNYAILSSAYSFSCGNLLPSQAKDNNIMLLGDKSGGGSCAVVDTTTYEGLYVRLSCQNHFLMKNNEELEMGVTPDLYLYEKNESTYDFSKFYDFSYISTKMNEFYNK